MAVGIVLGALLVFGVPTEAAAPGGQRNADATDYVIVEFGHAPISEYAGGIPGYATTKAAFDQRLDLSTPAALSYGVLIASEHANFRSWLQSNAPRAEVVREYSVVMNGLALLLHGTAPDVVRSAPRVSAVTSSWLYRPSMDVSVPLIHANEVWKDLGVSIGTPANFATLPSIKVGVIDTGIVDTHPFIASCRPANSVQHKVFFSGTGTSAFGPTIVFDHGTHVSGTIGGCPISGPVTVGSLSLALARPLSGVAPGVTLADYNVFPGYGAGFIAFGGSAFSHDIIAAVEASVLDGMDVINLSLGGGVAGPHDTLAEAINAAADAGVVAVVAAGNSGPGDMTAESPGNAAGALTAGASTNPHYLGIPVTVSGTTYKAALGDFGNFGTVTAPYTTTVPARGCTAISTPLTGKIALIDRGVCTFTTKVRNAQAAGAIGVLVVNNVAGDPIGMGQDGTTPIPTIPAAMLSTANGDAIKPSGAASIDGTKFAEIVTANADILAGFSSRGPTPFDFRIKPDITAPGVNVLSSVFGGKFAFFQGTSMATPHTSGASALLLAAHSNWGPTQVKSALVNTADRTVTDSRTGSVDPGVLARGGGRINVKNAEDTPATLWPASVSFGLWTGAKSVAGSRDVVFTNQRSSALTCSVSLVPTSATFLSLSASSISLAVGGMASVTVTLNGGQGIASGDYSGDIVASCGGTTLLAPWWFRIARTSGLSQGAAGSGSAAASDPLVDVGQVLYEGSRWVETA